MSPKTQRVEGGGKVYRVEIYSLVRIAHFIDGKSQRQVARELSLNRRTVQKIISQSLPLGYQRKQNPATPTLSMHIEWLDEILESDKKVHRKQRHTATRLYQRLKDERDYTGGYTTIRTYVAKKRLNSKEMFVPLSHDPGMAQADFGQAQAIINGIPCTVHFLVIQLPFSDGMFVKAYPSENTESFCEGHVSAFAFFGGVPKRILYDNTTIAVQKILGNGQRQQTVGFLALQSHYLFEQAFANVARGNEKGGVENLVGYSRRNFMVPLPAFENFEGLNMYLESCCRKRQLDVVRGHKETIEVRLSRESFLPLPRIPYECCRVQPGKINSQGLVRFQNNDYSVPTSTGQQKVLVKGYVDRVVIIFQGKNIAEHKRSYGQAEVLFNPLHYLKLLERKTGAFIQAAPLKGWKLPPIFQKVHEILSRKEGKEGSRQYIRLLQLLENYSVTVLEKSLEQAVVLEVVNEDAIKHLVKRQIENRPLNLALINYPAIPIVYVAPTNLNSYTNLLSQRGLV
jgi:transposase